ncbi:MAG TPA: hypothetical protein VFV74_06980 [Burkholderiales bacterium]|nr:hypothetical protein [Burkholderiales bacterium]
MSAAMNLSVVSRIVSSIPERTPRSLSGTAFTLDGARACSDPARLMNVARLLQWLSPLNPLTSDDQRMLGLNANAMRPGAFGEEGAAEDGDELRGATEERLSF